MTQLSKLMTGPESKDKKFMFEFMLKKFIGSNNCESKNVS